MLKIFRTLICSSSGACGFAVELQHWSIVLGSMCVGVSVWLGWSGIRVAGFSLQHGYIFDQRLARFPKLNFIMIKILSELLEIENGVLLN